MSALDTIIRLVYVAAAACFVLGLHLMNSPATARRGNQLSAVGMAGAVLGTIVLIASGDVSANGTLIWPIIVAGVVVGGGAGLYSARAVKMTAMPQLVSIFNAMGGGAAALVAIDEFVRAAGLGPHTLGPREVVATVLDVIIGSVTFTGSLIAAGKLQGVVTSRPVRLPAGQAVNAVVVILAAVSALYLIFVGQNVAVLLILLVVALVFGVTMVMPIDPEHHRRRLRDRGHRERRRDHRRGRLGPPGLRGRCGDPARLRPERHRGAGLRPGRGPGAAPGP
jgi:NAD(P) transhydrogenase subunit beta